MSAVFDFAIVNGKYVGEDYLFCDRATSMGFKVHIDVDISLPHVGSYEFTRTFREEVVARRTAFELRKARERSQHPRIHEPLPAAGD
jgi:hypothetical protein